MAPAVQPPAVMAPALQAPAVMALATMEAGPSGLPQRATTLQVASDDEDLDEPPQPPMELLLLASRLSEEEIALVRTFEFTCHYFPSFCPRN